MTTLPVRRKWSSGAKHSGERSMRKAPFRSTELDQFVSGENIAASIESGTDVSVPREVAKIRPPTLSSTHSDLLQDATTRAAAAAAVAVLRLLGLPLRPRAARPMMLLRDELRADVLWLRAVVVVAAIGGVAPPPPPPV